MDTGIQIQSIKSQIENMKLQIDNIEMQSNNNMMFNPSMIYEQILNISIQMFNAGIQAFNIGKNMVMMMNMQNFYNQLKKISEQIHLILNENSMQQFPQQIMMQPQMQAPQILIPQEQIMSLRFENPKGWKIIINIGFESTVEEAINKFIHKAYGSCNKKLVFLYNANEIKRDEQRKIKDFFNRSPFASITVLEV